MLFRSRKRTRHEHFLVTRYGTPINKQKELDIFYKKVDEYKFNKIISLDETSIKPSMLKEYSRCKLGKRCVVKTDDSYIFRKFTLLVAIKNSKCVGWKLYEKGGMTKERLVEFLEEFVFDKYKNHLIILDNAGSHRNNYVKDAITESENNYLFSVPYTPKTNVVEMFFNQIKHYLKLKWNRDENSARNIYKIAKNAICKKERPTYLSRSKKVISGTSSVGKLQCHSTSVEATQSKFTRLETVKLC